MISVPRACAVWQRNATMYKRTWTWNLLPNFFEPVLYLASLGVGVGSYISQMGGMSYIEFIAPGLLCVAAMNGASFEVTYNIYVRLAHEKAYDSMLTTPIEPEDILLGEALWAVSRATIYGACFFIVLLIAGLAPMPRSLLTLAIIPLTGLLFAIIGITFTVTIRTIDFFSFYYTLFLTPLFLFSGVFFPLEERFSAEWLWVAEILPLIHPVRLVRAVFRGEAAWTVGWDLLYIALVVLFLGEWARRKIRNRLMN